MKILITGSNGLLGQAVASVIVRESNHEVILSSVEEKSFHDFGKLYLKLDITSKEDVKKVVAYHKPSVIINCAAFTNVDKCETERELSWKINVDGVKNIIIAAKKNDVKVVHYSTDYVFDGKNGPYDELAVPNPVSFYGREKLASENSLITSDINFAIIRTLVLYGTGDNVKPNFALWMLDNLRNNRPVNIVTDQISNVTMIDDLAFGTLNSGLIILKMESELGFKPMDSIEGLRLLKFQLGY